MEPKNIDRVTIPVSHTALNATISPVTLRNYQKKKHKSKKRKKHAHDSFTLEALRDQYLVERCEPVGLDPENLSIPAIHPFTGEYINGKMLAAGTYGGMHVLKFAYLDHKGKSLTYHNPETGQEDFLMRVRPVPGQEPVINGKPAKYLTLKGATNRAYLTPIVYLTKVKGHSIKTDKFFTIEGEFKAWAGANLLGLHMAGTIGLHGAVEKNMFGTIRRYDFKTELEDCLLDSDPNYYILLNDADADDNKAAESKGRAANFTAAVAANLSAVNRYNTKHGKQVKLIYKYLADKQYKGLDDLLAAKPEEAADIKTELESTTPGKGKYFFTFQISTKHDVSRVGYFLRRTPGRAQKPLTIKKYLSELAPKVRTAIKEYGRVLIAGDPGTGKTTLAITDVARQWAGKTVVLVPLGAITKDFYQKYKADDVAVITGESGTIELADAANCKIIIVTYDSWRKVSGMVDPATTLFILDELHYPVLESDWKERGDDEGRYRLAINELLRMPNVLALSATPPLYIEALGFHVMRIAPKVQVKYKYKQVKRKGGNSVAAFIQYMNTESLPNGKSLIRRNNKSELRDLKKWLCEHYNLPASAVGLQYSIKDNPTTQAEAEEQEQVRELAAYVAENRKLPEDMLFLLCTSVWDCGVNLENACNWFVYCLDDQRIHPKTLIQFVARPRLPLVVPVVHFVKDSEKEHTDYSGGFFTSKYKLEKEAEELNNSLNSVNERRAKAGIQNRICFSDKDYLLIELHGNIYPDWLHLLADAERAFSSGLSNETFRLYLEALPNWETSEATAEMTLAKDPIQEAAAELKKEEQARILEEMAQLLVADGENVLAAYYYIHAGKDSKVRKRLKTKNRFIGNDAPQSVQEFYHQHRRLFAKGMGFLIGRYLDLEKYHLKPDKDVLTLINAAWGKLITPYKKIDERLNISEFSRLQQVDIKQQSRLQDELKSRKGNIFTGDDLKALARQYVSRCGGKDNRKALKIIRSLCSLEETGKDGHGNRYYLVGDVWTHENLKFKVTAEMTYINKESINSIPAVNEMAEFKAAPF